MVAFHLELVIIPFSVVSMNSIKTPVTQCMIGVDNANKILRKVGAGRGQWSSFLKLSKDIYVKNINQKVHWCFSRLSQCLQQCADGCQFLRGSMMKSLQVRRCTILFWTFISLQVSFLLYGSVELGIPLSSSNSMVLPFFFLSTKIPLHSSARRGGQTYSSISQKHRVPNDLLIRANNRGPSAYN